MMMASRQGHGAGAFRHRHAAEMLSLAGLCCEPADCPEQHDVARQHLEEAKLVMAQLQALIDENVPKDQREELVSKRDRCKS